MWIRMMKCLTNWYTDEWNLAALHSGNSWGDPQRKHRHGFHYYVETWNQLAQVLSKDFMEKEQPDRELSLLEHEESLASL
ncbi:Protein CBG21453 [Caenorhabditis briggsae]|uniref:Protein CBG21448 n=1 Tax=Caenorhabditis briggsae TaxID=6238 RepID=G2J720_CAEBR|nr:Protein CBG21448 [Caenorhabditis briggsae]XP_002649008.1 Protein CBG21453 [Caenorhabditis briggsae]CAP38246.1 Protein CBG21448 [Caenorhabditis briggsae]CAP38248.1 Protein CBG21453 [Caenorhabditis briggsae]